jgi:hypothetical protein
MTRMRADLRILVLQQCLIRCTESVKQLQAFHFCLFTFSSSIVTNSREDISYCLSWGMWREVEHLDWSHQIGSNERRTLPSKKNSGTSNEEEKNTLSKSKIKKGSRHMISICEALNLIPSTNQNR